MHSQMSAELPSTYDDVWMRLWYAADGGIVLMRSVRAGVDYPPRRRTEEWLRGHQLFCAHSFQLHEPTMMGHAAILEKWSSSSGGGSSGYDTP